MKTTKVYHAPGYPLDPAKEEKRAFEGLSEYRCKIIPPDPIERFHREVMSKFEKAMGVTNISK